MSIIDTALEGAGTALLQRTYMIQTRTLSGVPVLLCVFDCVTSEQPTYIADVTQHPVESGTEVTDHIQLKNPTLKIVGTISNTPIDLSTTVGNLISSAQGLLTSSAFRTNALNSGLQQGASIAGASLLGAASGSAPSFKSIAGAAAGAAADALARAALISAYQNKAIFDVVTKRQRYTSMAIQSLSFPKDTNTGMQVVFELDLVQVRIITTSSVALSSVAEGVNTSALPKTDLGSQATSGVSSQASNAVNGSAMKSVFG